MHNQRRGKIYACFVDFRKAFDSVWHKGPFLQIRAIRHTWKPSSILKNIYPQASGPSAEWRLIMQWQISSNIQDGSNCSLSPTLFNTYLNDLIPELKTSNSSPLGLPNKSSVSCIMYADDLILLSESVQGLQSMLDNLQNFCELLHLSLNT